jgi:transposase-like protein
MSIDLSTIAERYNTEEKAREFLERVRWPDGAICPHCGCKNARKIGRRSGVTRHARPGLWYCKDCGDQFTVTEGTVMEHSHIPLQKWLMAIYLLNGSKKGISAHQLHRELGVTYKSAWFMAHRIRYAMHQEPIRSKLKGVVEIDETYVGGLARNRPDGKVPDKHPVVSLVQRETGEARSFHVPRVTAANLRAIVRKHVDPDSTVYTDSLSLYGQMIEDVMAHESVNHKKGEYKRGPVYTNTVEGFFSILKRGLWHLPPRFRAALASVSFGVRLSVLTAQGNGRRSGNRCDRRVARQASYVPPIASA